MTVIYATSSFPHKNGGQPGRFFEKDFVSVELALKTRVPEEYEFAFISTEEDKHVFTRRFGWELVAGVRA